MGLQQVVNEPLSEQQSWHQPETHQHFAPDSQTLSAEQKTAPVQDFGYKFFGDVHMEEQGDRQTAPKQAAGRVLKMQKTDDGDDSMRPAEAQQPQPEQSSPPPPPQTSEPDFWTKMSMMMDMKLDKQVDKLTSWFNDLEVRMQKDKMDWKAALEKEITERKSEMEMLKLGAQKLSEKVTEMEQSRSPHAPQTSSAPASADGWIADHIVGGPAMPATAEENIAWMESLLATVPAHDEGDIFVQFNRDEMIVAPSRSGGSRHSSRRR